MLIGIDASRATREQRTGTEGYSLHLIRALLELDQHNEYVLYFNRPPRPGLFPASPRWRARVMPCPRLWTHVRLSLEMLAAPPDVLFVPAHVLPIVHPRRSVVTVHDLGYRHEPQAHRPLDRLYLELSTRYNARAASQVIADSAATKRDLVQLYGTDPQRITVVPLGVDELFQPVNDAARLAAVRAQYGIPGDYLLYVGTLQPRKNLVRLIEAWNKIRNSNFEIRNWVLVIAGKRGWLYEEIFATVQRLGLEGQVLFPGYVPEEDLPALLSGATAFVLPSLYEGFGLPVLEAMACGTPVIAANVASLPEVVGDAGLLVDPLDTDALAAAMQRLLTDAAPSTPLRASLRAELRQRGLARAKLFSWPRCAWETLAVLKNAQKLT
jgi:glycosyltransferase involved in cell wall biosynthesis